MKTYDTIIIEKHVYMWGIYVCRATAASKEYNIYI